VERISTAEAAHRLGVSPSTVRRLVRAGALRSESEQRPQGTRLVILWDVTAPVSTTIQDASDHASAPDASDRAAPAAVSDEVAWLRARLEHAEQERERLQQTVTQATQTVAMLVVRLRQAGTPDVPDQASHTPEHASEAPKQAPPARRERRPWWAFFWARRG